MVLQFLWESRSSPNYTKTLSAMTGFFVLRQFVWKPRITLFPGLQSGRRQIIQEPRQQCRGFLFYGSLWGSPGSLCSRDCNPVVAKLYKNPVSNGGFFCFTAVCGEAPYHFVPGITIRSSPNYTRTPSAMTGFFVLRQFIWKPRITLFPGLQSGRCQIIQELRQQWRGS